MERPDYGKFAEATEEYKTSTVLRAEREAREKAELLAKNLARRGQQISAARRRTKEKARYEENKEFHLQVGLAARDQLQQFINELAGMTLVPVGDFRDRDAVVRRKDQLSIMGSTLSSIQALMKFQAQLAEEYNIRKEDEKEGMGSNVILLRQAEKLIKKASK